MFDTYFNTLLLGPIVVARKLRQCFGARQSAELAPSTGCSACRCVSRLG
jgi:hypothetical protein